MDVWYLLFVIYFNMNETASPAQLGPFHNEHQCELALEKLRAVFRGDAYMVCYSGRLQ